MMGAQNGSSRRRLLTLDDGTIYHAIQVPGVVADSTGVSLRAVVAFQTPDGRRIASVHLAPGATLEELSDEALAELLEEALGR